MNAFITALESRFEKLAPRERQLVTVLGCTLLLALMWSLAISPALQTWRGHAAAHAKLDAELAQMQSLAAEAKALQAVPPKTAAQAQSWLASSIKKLGKATLSNQGERVQVNFNSVSADSLALWLTEARTTAALLPLEAHWKRQDGEKTILWDGVILFELPR
jgi:general secretion pathway protein M